MSDGRVPIPTPVNEPILSYAPGSEERASLQARVRAMEAETAEAPMVIGGQETKGESTFTQVSPHRHSRELARVHAAGSAHVLEAVDAARGAAADWAATSFEERAAVFLKAADLISGPYRDTINAATILGQSKSVHQAEIDAVCELVDFIRFNAFFAQEILEEQPFSPDGMWNRMDYRPLEGFVLAITPFNFTAIAANLPSAPALMGNVVVWKPSEKQALAAHYTMEVFRKAGLPDGVINLVHGDGALTAEVALAQEDLAGLHFTGSEGTFNHLWKTIGKNLDKYRTYPRIVGETGGKDFIFAHNSADVDRLVPATVRGAFEYQGQKCSAASRMYVPKSIWGDFSKKLKAEVKKIKMGDVEDFSNFMGAVISRKAFDKISEYIDYCKESDDAEIIAGGGYDDSKGYFIEPTVVVTTDPKFRTMKEEIFGPVLTIYIYEDEKFEETLDLCDGTSKYALTGAVWARDRYTINHMANRLKNSAGNFYINDKPTGAVVNQQPFGGARKSGTNDKAGSMVNLYRWISMRSIKETYAGPTDFRYPYMD